MDSQPPIFYISALIVIGTLAGVVYFWASNMLNTRRVSRAFRSTDLLDLDFQEIARLSPEERRDALPRMEVPSVTVSLSKDYLRFGENCKAQLRLALDCYAKTVLRSSQPDQSFFVLDNPQLISTIAACYQASPRIRFVAWIELSMGPTSSTWEMFGAELRPFGQPSPLETHFAKSATDSKRYESVDEGFGGVALLAWDALGSNINSPEIAKRANYFKALLLRAWSDALTEADNSISRIPDAADIDSNPSRRPSRRE